MYKGEHESISGSSAQEQEFEDFIERRWWVTDSYDAQLTARGPVVEGVWRDAVTVRGRSGEIHPAPLQEGEALEIWNDGLVRPLRLVPSGRTTQLEGIDVWEYTLDPSELIVNDFYYQGIKGAFNASSYRSANLFYSMPRQRHMPATQTLVTHEPSAEQLLVCCTDWRLYVEPESGLTLGKDTPTQLNFESHGYGTLHVSSHLPPGIMPFMWAQQRSVVGAKDAASFKDNQSLLSAFLAVGVVLAIVKKS